jgi:hypothetical protein
VDRQVAIGPAQCWQKAFGSAMPASLDAMSDGEQATKQYIGLVDSKEAQTSLKLPRHSPGTAQQSVSDWQVWVQ